MIKLFKSLFPLCILLMSGYLQKHEGIFYESTGTFSVEKSQHSVSKSGVFTTKTENKQNHITDIEGKDDEVVSFKKQSSFSTNIRTPFFTRIAEYLFQYTQIHLCLNKHFSYYSSGKSLYLIFAVMRI